MSGQNIEIVKLQIRRGNEADLPVLDVGEPAVTTDTHKLFIGDGTTNHQFAKQEDLDTTNLQVAEKVSLTSGLQLKGTVLAINSTNLTNLKNYVSRSVNEYGMNFFIIGLLYRQDLQTDTNIYAFSDLPTAWSLVDYIKTTFPNVTIAVNCYLTSMDTNAGSVTPSNTTTWFTNWKTILTGVASTCQSKGIKYIGIENENSNMGKVAYQSNWQDIVTSLHTYGLQVFNSANYWDWQTNCLASVVDILGFNFYPQLTLNGKNETDTNIKKGLYFDLVGATFMAQLTKLASFNKPIWITEIGCSGNVDALKNTSQVSGFATPTIDLAIPAFYYEYILNFVGKSKCINGMALFSVNGLTADWSYLDNPNGEVIKKYWVQGV